MAPSRLAGLVLAGSLAAGCATRPLTPRASDPRPYGPDWSSPLLRQHPLSGRILDVRGRRWIDQATLDAAQAAPGVTADGIAEAVEWSKGGWPEFTLYRPIFEAGLAARLRLVAANLPRPAAREVMKQGVGTLPDDTRAWLVTGTPATTGVCRPGWSGSCRARRWWRWATSRSRPGSSTPTTTPKGLARRSPTTTSSSRRAPSARTRASS